MYFVKIVFLRQHMETVLLSDKELFLQLLTWLFCDMNGN